MKKYIILLFFLSFVLLSFGQQGFRLNIEKPLHIPFKFINNLIFIPMQVNGVELTFMLDSGIDETILFSLENKEVQFNNVKKVKLKGLGSANEIDGMISQGNKVNIGKHLIDTLHKIIIILNEDFNFSSHIGIPINGIIGYQFFKNYPVRINFENRKIYIYPNESKKYKRLIKKREPYNISIEKNRPYMQAVINMNTQKVDSKLLIDLGNSDGIWLFSKELKDFIYPLPNFDDYLGRGFNGDIYGKRSKVEGIYIDKYYLKRPFVAIPNDASITSLELVENRKGSIGTEIFKRFNIILDYPNHKIYFDKNTLFEEEFKYNMAGIDLKYDGTEWAEESFLVVDFQTTKATNPQKDDNKINEIPVNKMRYKFVLKPIYSVAGVRNNSPASEADIRKGDVLQKVNGHPASKYKLEDLNNLFVSKENKEVSFELKRGTEIIKKTIILKDPLK